ncbi:glutaredoxin family protein [Ammoniphilus sp. CFH 90114]|uniref:glutaredoxin family protein n=1 Tax=Ammoniphilus sp. CFH 90114 TaxID=2493665 RepID=UPI00100E73CA|nr:glutaredoxin family protein [Ammoniphilus sp. CFH 90114]RXT05234.1 glutaredoxin family protein [Ammoniphilus sp. CFH 90114]
MEVIVYSSTGCIKCLEVKEQLREWRIPFEERNVSDNEQYFKELQERRIFGTPATFINGRVVLGFQPKKLQERLGLTEESIG